MRRGLSFASLALLLAGLELATESVSLTLARLRTGITALVAGSDFHVGGQRFVIGLAAVAIGLAIWTVLFWSSHTRLKVDSVGSACPQCGERTRRVKRLGRQKILSMVLGERIVRRRCERCGWVGLSLGS